MLPSWEPEARISMPGICNNEIFQVFAVKKNWAVVYIHIHCSVINSKANTDNTCVILINLMIIMHISTCYIHTNTSRNSSRNSKAPSGVNQDHKWVETNWQGSGMENPAIYYGQCSHITVFISKLTPTSISGQIVRFTSTSELIRRFAKIKIYKQ